MWLAGWLLLFFFFRSFILFSPLAVSSSLSLTLSSYALLLSLSLPQRKWIGFDFSCMNFKTWIERKINYRAGFSSSSSLFRCLLLAPLKSYWVRRTDRQTERREREKEREGERDLMCLGYYYCSSSAALALAIVALVDVSVCLSVCLCVRVCVLNPKWGH